MSTESHPALLLRKTLLSNDDAILEFMTPDMGRVSVFARKFAKSKKKAAEVDYFRLLEVNLYKGKSSYSLRGVRSVRSFDQPLTCYQTAQVAYSWLEKLKQTVPENVDTHTFFYEVLDHLTALCPQHVALHDGYFRTRLLDYKGHCPTWETPETRADTKLITFFRDACMDTFLHFRQHIPLNIWDTTEPMLCSLEAHSG